MISMPRCAWNSAQQAKHAPVSVAACQRPIDAGRSKPLASSAPCSSWPSGPALWMPAEMPCA